VLYVKNTKITDEGITLLASLPNLRHLYIPWTPNNSLKQNLKITHPNLKIHISPGEFFDFPFQGSILV